MIFSEIEIGGDFDYNRFSMQCGEWASYPRRDEFALEVAPA
jgi:hypothetical protein